MDETLEQRAQRIFGESATAVIPRLFKEGKGITRVAILLEVQPNSIRHWLKTNGYRVTSRRVVVFEKVAQHE